MPYNPAIHNRHSIRLPGYDYTKQGAYFLTINTYKKEHLFGEVTDGVVQLSPMGEVILEQWQRIPTHFPNVLLDVFVIMPNHIHGILVITGDELGTGKGKGKEIDLHRTQNSSITSSPSNNYKKSKNLGSIALPPLLGSQSGSLPAIVQNFKSTTSRKINKELNTPGSTIWHRNYYEHVIRDEEDYERIVTYIHQNPQK
jgi:REP element-mobilizing transposase RayT